MKIEIQRLSNQYIVRELSKNDVEAIYELCAGNEQFYRYHPPFVTRESILGDLKDLPPGKTLEDKLFVGFYDNDILIAVMDLILGFPNKETAFIGLFMMNMAYQGRGISMNGSLEDSPQVQAGKFFRRITDVLWNSTLEENTSPLDKKPYISLRDHGNVNILWSSETDEVSFVIDGKPFTLQEFGDLLENYEGWTMQFQMRDRTEPIVKENEFLLPVELTNEALLSELTHAIWSFSEDDGDVPFISYKDTANLSEAVFGIIKKLEVMAHNYPPEMTIETGKAMIALLEAVKTDDDFFPDYEIDMIGELIDLYK